MSTFIKNSHLNKELHSSLVSEDNFKLHLQFRITRLWKQWAEQGPRSDVWINSNFVLLGYKYTSMHRIIL